LSLTEPCAPVEPPGLGEGEAGDEPPPQPEIVMVTPLSNASALCTLKSRRVI
jgi:hypothetical protein